MKYRLPLAVLLIGLTLTACGSPAAPQAEDTPPTRLEAASGLDGEEILLTVDGREIPAWRYLYWLAYTCGQLDRRYQEAELPLDWSAPAEEGTLADYAKDQALADTALYAVVENWAAAYVPQTPETAQTPEAPEPPAESPRSSALPDLGLEPEQREQLEAVGRSYAALWALCQQGDTALAPTPEELAAYGREAGAVTVDRVLISFGSDREAARQRASEVFARLNEAGDEAARGARFTELAGAGDDRQGPRTLLPGEGDESVLEAARTLEEGQCSGILESPEGFFLLRRVALDGEALLPFWFDHALETAAGQAQVTVTEAYEALRPDAFYEALTRGSA